jgi:hypothetical protein
VLGPEIRDQVCRLIPAFGVCHRTTEILRVFDALCHESLAIAVTERSSEHSRINSDGTPFQFALDLSGARAGPFQFLGEAGHPGADPVARHRASAAAWSALARTCRAEDEAAAAAPALALLAPTGHRSAPLPASLFWFAVRFPVDGPPAVTVYVNGAWGPEHDRWRRFDALAAATASTPRWRALRDITRAMAPVGAAITVRSGEATTARAYFRAYGLPATAYRDALSAAAPSAVTGAAFDECVGTLLGDAVGRPTQSVVFSSDLCDSARAGAKVEMCAHCAFVSDAEAEARIGQWLRGSGLGEVAYLTALDVLTGGVPVPAPARRASLHAYVGVGVRGGDAYASVYLNPGAVLG